MKFGELLFPFYLCMGLLTHSSAESLSPSPSNNPAGTNGGKQNRSQDLALGPSPDYLNVSHEIKESLIKPRGSFGKEWKGEKIVVEVQKCAGADASMSAQWFQVPEEFQVPLSAEKAERIRGRFRNGLFNFTLVGGGAELDCVNESTMHNYSFSRNESASKREGTEEAPLPAKYTFFTDYFSPYGDLKTVKHGYQYPPTTYCISSVTAEAIGFEICDPRERNSAQGPSTGELPGKERDESVVITKCCSPGLVAQVAYNATSGAYHVACVEAFEEEWTPYFFQRFATLASGFGYSASDTDAGVAGKQRPYYRHKSLMCKSTIHEFFPDEHLSRAQPLKVAQIRILESGEILIRPTGQHEWGRPKETPTRKDYIDTTNMCIDGLLSVDDVNDVTRAEMTYTRSPNHQVILYCSSEEPPLSKSPLVNFSISCVTSVFLAIIVVVYMLIWKSHNIHARTSAAFSVFVFLFHLSTALSHGALIFAHQKIILFHSNTCVAIAVVNLFSYIGMFSWMTILNFDLWVTLRSMTPAARRSRGTKRFLGYCSFGLGAPLIVVSVALGFEHGFGLFEEGVFRPLFGRFACVVDRTAIIYYHIFPCLLLFLVNAVFAVLTIISLYTWKKDTQRINKSNSKASRSQGKLVCKLFLLMGFSWTLDLLAWFVVEDELAWYWIIFDAYNILQAVGLFWIFVFKKEVKDELCKSYAPIKSVSDWMEGALKRGLSSSPASGPTSSHSTGTGPNPTKLTSDSNNLNTHQHIPIPTTVPMASPGST